MSEDGKVASVVEQETNSLIDGVEPQKCNKFKPKFQPGVILVFLGFVVFVIFAICVTNRAKVKFTLKRTIPTLNVVLISGGSSTEFLGVLDDFSSFNRSCHAPEYPQEVSHNALFFFMNEQLMMCGGISNKTSQPTKACYGYIKSNQTWIRKANLSHPRSHLIGVFFDKNEFWIMSRFKSDLTSEIYRPDQGSFNFLTLPTFDKERDATRVNKTHILLYEVGGISIHIFDRTRPWGFTELNAVTPFTKALILPNSEILTMHHNMLTTQLLNLQDLSYPSWSSGPHLPANLAKSVIVTISKTVIIIEVNTGNAWKLDHHTGSWAKQENVLLEVEDSESDVHSVLLPSNYLNCSDEI